MNSGSINRLKTTKISISDEFISQIKTVSGDQSVSKNIQCG